jgi:hypothetical protein
MAMIMEVMESLDKLKSEPPCTPTPAGKHAHSFSADMSIRKRPGIVTRTQKKALEALGPLEDGPRSGGRIQKSPHMPVTLFT